MQNGREIEYIFFLYVKSIYILVTDCSYIGIFREILLDCKLLLHFIHYYIQLHDKDCEIEKREYIYIYIQIFTDLHKYLLSI